MEDRRELSNSRLGLLRVIKDMRFHDDDGEGDALFTNDCSGLLQLRAVIFHLQ